MYANSHIPLINRPTSITRGSPSLIDKISRANFDIWYDIYSDILQTDISDHYLGFHLSDADSINAKKTLNEYQIFKN